MKIARDMLYSPMGFPDLTQSYHLCNTSLTWLEPTAQRHLCSYYGQACHRDSGYDDTLDLEKEIGHLIVGWIEHHGQRFTWPQ